MHLSAEQAIRIVQLWSGEEEAADTKTVAKKRPWHSTPPSCSASLVFTHGKKSSEQTFCTLVDGSYHVKKIPEMCGMKCFASDYGWWLMVNKYSTQCYLFNPTLFTKIHLPPLIDGSFSNGVLTSSPSDPNCHVVFCSIVRKSFIRCGIGDSRWIEEKLRTELEMSIYLSVVSCRGNIYMFFPLGVAVIDVGNNFVAELHEIKRQLFSIPETILTSKFFVESCGEIFLILELHLGFSLKIVQTLDVFRFDFSTMDWVAVETLGDRVFLLSSTSCTSLSSTELGMKGNSIYFTTQGYTSLNRFQMEGGTITTTLPCSKKFSHWDEPFWVVVPECKPQVNNAMENVAQVQVHRNRGQSDFQFLPLELLELICSGLFLGDCIRFRLTCKTWMAINPPVRSYAPLPHPESEPQQLPWLLFFPKINEGQCTFHHPVYSDTHMIKTPELAGAIVRHAKYGWLLMSRGHLAIFFFNPLTKETIELPQPPFNYSFVNISFSSPPTSSDCVVFAHSPSAPLLVDIIFYVKGETEWFHVRIPVPHSFVPSHCSPVFYNGVFYSLGKDGRLSVFNPNEIGEDDMWRLLPIAPVPQAISSDLCFTSIRSFIMECGGEIFSVYVQNHGKPIWVFNLDRTQNKWVRLESLGEKVIFLSHTGSIVLPAGVRGIENRIYLPRFHEKENVYFSLSTGNYNCFGGKWSRPDWIETSEIWNCSWIQQW